MSTLDDRPANPAIGEVRPNKRGGVAALIQSPVAIRLGALLILAIGLSLLHLSGRVFWQGLVINLGIFMILVLSLNLASGFTGVFSLGHIGFMALGAYGSAILTLPLAKKADYLPNLPAWLASIHFDFYLGPFPLGFLLATLLAAGLVAGVALLVGLVLMRLSGHFVAVATLGFLVIVRVILFNADNFTRGSRTFSNVTPYTGLWWVWFWAILTLYVVWRLKYSAYGRAMLAQREDALAAQAVGLAIMPPRLLAFVVSAFFTAVAGSLYAHFITSFSPTVFYFDLTFRVITMLIVGGLGSVSGSVLGTVVIIALAEALRRLEDVTLLYGMSQITLAVIFIVIILFRPNGLLGRREIVLARLFRKGGEPSP
ncbi:MAG: branched-chain amino acid ABC transporter permease [Anaerolineales bacterium]|nr:branched-chain amino acid ABC transporter permease [Anaerolineales bacterium]